LSYTDQIQIFFVQHVLFLLSFFASPLLALSSPLLARCLFVLVLFVLVCNKALSNLKSISISVTEPIV